MPIASGAGHWPKEHLVAAVIEPAANPSSPSYVQSYMPQWVSPNKIVPPKQSYIIHGPNQPVSPSFQPRNSYPQNGPPTENPNVSPNRSSNPDYETPPPRYSSPNPRDGGPQRSPWGRNPNPQQKPPRFFRGSEKYGHGHHRFGSEGTRPGTRPDFGHNKYGVQYNNSRQVISTARSGRPVGPKGLESYEMYGPRMNMTTGCCGPQMRPLWAMLGGLLALGALGGVITGIALGAKSATTVKKLPYVSPLGVIRYYQQNGAFELCVDRYATTTTLKTTPTTPTKPTTTGAPTTARLTTRCVPVTINIATDPPATTGNANSKTTQTTKLATTRTTTVCILPTVAPTTPYISTTQAATTTIITTTPALTTQTTYPFCDTLTTSYTLITMNPLPVPYSGARPNSPAGVVGLLFLLLAFAAKLLVD